MSIFSEKPQSLRDSLRLLTSNDKFCYPAEIGSQLMIYLCPSFQCSYRAVVKKVEFYDLYTVNVDGHTKKPCMMKGALPPSASVSTVPHGMLTASTSMAAKRAGVALSFNSSAKKVRMDKESKSTTEKCRMPIPITKIHARQIYDCRGIPTVEVDLYTEKGVFRAAVPSGASTGVHEALELRDKDYSIHHGKGVTKAVANINNKIAPAIIAKKFMVTQQTEIDEFMIALDGTENKSNLGANAILGVSLAVAKAGAVHKGMPLYKHIAELAGILKIVLPVPAFNVINGGSHAGNKLAMQLMILPVGASSFKEAMRMGTEVYHHLKAEIKNRYGLDATAVGDRGGFAPNIQNIKEGLDLLNTAIASAGYTGKISIGMDVVASEFYKDGKYDLDFKNPESDPSKWLTGDELGELYQSFVKEYPVVSIEDAFDQDDWEHWSKFMAGTSIQLVGDDLTVTNPQRIQLAIDKKSCNCLLLKVNQIGSVTESIEAAKLSRANGWGVMVSHRSGETEDTFIADLVVGLATGQIKIGAPCRSERLAKYNQLLRIEEELGADAVYAGHNFRNPQAQTGN